MTQFIQIKKTSILKSFENNTFTVKFLVLPTFIFWILIELKKNFFPKTNL